jgi:hypothetical protein
MKNIVKNIIKTATVISMILLSVNVKAQVFKLENDTVQYLKFDKNYSIVDNLKYRMFEYSGYGYGRTDTLVIDFNNMVYIAGSNKPRQIISLVKGENDYTYMTDGNGVRYFSIYQLDKVKNRWFVLYVNESTYEGGLYYPTVIE